MTALERTSQYVVWFIAAFTVVFLMTPLVVTIAVSFGSSTVFTLPPPDWSLRCTNVSPACAACCPRS